MTPRRYFTFACFTALIQGGVIASQDKSSDAPQPAGTVIGTAQSMNITIGTHATQKITASPANKEQATNKQLASPKKPEHKPTHPVKSNALVKHTSEVLKSKNNLNALTQAKPQQQKVTITENIQVSKKRVDDQLSVKKTINEPKAKPLDMKAKQKLDIDSNRQFDSQGSKGTQALAQTSIALNQPTFSAPPSQPNYPKLARKRGLEGTATIEVMFNQIGEQLSLTLINSSGFTLLDKAALNAVKKWQFSAPSPPKSYAYTVRVPVRFALN
ncbi:TonB family protein [Shewanella sp. VB17]|uniref:energy transducer TonB n=1 Tax=Shewanella sp. VB17 TaxID=2739432 RepID=UPI001562EDE8|nr:energy transducer TonB [Shewanella sp. VB17]NRD73205.1 TonB family protein [Shewanella sp. VB17]